jgi:hypothetical protein
MIDNFYYVDANNEGKKRITRVRDDYMDAIDAIRLRAENARRVNASIGYDDVFQMTLTN